MTLRVLDFWKQRSHDHFVACVTPRYYILSDVEVLFAIEKVVNTMSFHVIFILT